MSEKVAYCNGKWGSESSAALALDDWGLMQGAVVVDRLRTCNVKPLDKDLHVSRLIGSCNSIGIQAPEAAQLTKLIDECVRKNAGAYAGLDFSVVVMVTPGRASHGPRGKVPTVIVHSTPLNWMALRSWYQSGQALVIAKCRNVPPQVWSPQIKTRARLHYYLADCQAEQISLPHAGAVLLSMDGSVTESSMANIIIVDKNQRLICPLEQEVLNGISLRRTLRLAEQAGFKVEFTSVRVDIAGVASELLLTGSSGCLWPASRFGDIAFEAPAKRPVFAQLSELWCRDISLNYVEQAEKACESLKNVM